VPINQQRGGRRWVPGRRAVARYGVRVSLLMAAIALVAIPFSLLTIQVVQAGPLTRADRGIAENLNDHVRGHRFVVDGLQVLSFLGKPVWLFAMVGIPVVWLVVRGSRKLALFLSITAIGGSIIDSVVKLAVHRSRPALSHAVAHAFGKSFPSGHAMSSTVCYVALLLVFLPSVPHRRRRLTIVAVVVLLVAIGASRLALGVHFLSDVLGGWILGAAWLLASVAAFEVWREERGRRRTEPLEEGIEPEEAPEAPGADA